ncbi:MAG: tetratricopeptide repeat protein, partial [Dokdonella sp.]
LTGLGQALGAEGSHDQAIAALMRAEQIDVQALGPMHTFTLVAKIALADARLSAGDASGAETGFRQSLDAFSKIGDGKHIYAEAARLGLGKALAAEHRCAEAEPSLVEARSRFGSEFGADDRRTIESATFLIHCMAEQGRKKQAKELFQASEQALNKADHDVTRQRIRLQSVKAEVDG